MSYLIPDLVRVESCCARAVGLLYRRAAIVTFYHQVFPLESQEGATVSVGKKKCCLSFQAVFEKTYLSTWYVRISVIFSAAVLFLV